MPAPPISIVMPVYNEAIALVRHIDQIQHLMRVDDELIVVDGGSTDATWTLIEQQRNLRALRSGKGRALQMNAGAALARNPVLLFLHADTVITPKAWQALLAALAHHHDKGPCIWGRFDVAIVGHSKCLPMVAWFMNHRSRLSRIATGDQALFLSRELFEQLGGFPQQPLMEDVELSKRLKRMRGALFIAIREKVYTSGRRWDTHGAWKTIVLMWRLRFQYWRGASAERIAEQYRDTRSPNTLPLTVLVGVFAKYPEAGRVKTRLEPLLGFEACARFARYLLQSTLMKLRDAQLHVSHIAQRPLQLDVAVWSDGGSDSQWLALLSPPVASRHTQPEGHLGVRMETAVRTHLSSHDVVVLLGPDAVQFNKSHLQRLVEGALLQGVAIAPALDGGYVAIACTRAALPALSALFSEHIAWGTPSVAEQTRHALSLFSMNACWLEPQMDIDEPDDLKQAVELGFVPPNWNELTAGEKRE